MKHLRLRRPLMAVALVAALTPLVTGSPAAASRADVGAPSAAASAVFQPSGGGMTGYRIHDLAGGGELDGVEVLDISDSGRMIGNDKDLGKVRGFQWVRDGGGIQPLSGPSGDLFAAAVASNGSVAGNARGAGAVTGVLRWTAGPDGALGAPTVVAAAGTAAAVNAKGEVLVQGNGIDTVVGPAGSRQLRSLYTAGSPSAFASSQATRLNDAGQAAGVSQLDPDGIGPEKVIVQLTVWDGDQPRGLGIVPLPGTTSAEAINRSGTVLARVTDADLRSHAFVSDGKGGFREVGAPAGFTEVYPQDMNDDGLVLALAKNATGAVTSFVWRDGTALDLNRLVTDRSWTQLVVAGLNDHGQIAALGVHDGVTVPVLLDPVDPVVMIHGAGASRLSTYNAQDEETSDKWMSCTESRSQLSLFPEDDPDPSIQAADALRFPFCYIANHHYDEQLDIYGTLLERLTATGTFREYAVDGHPRRRTQLGCDLTQQDASPNLFVFAYDWRKSNVEAAGQLADYMACIRKFWPISDVDIVTHSMGGLVARRYLLDHADHHVRRVVTLGAPWLGATKLVNVLQTGDFAPGAVNGPKAVIRHIVSGFPAAHQLMASRLYQDSAGPPIVRENGWDINGDGVSADALSYDQTANLLNGQYPRTRPATTADTFQTYSTGEGGQIDWRNDSTGVEYVHVVGLQAGRNTIGTVVANQAVTCSLVFICGEEQFISQDLVCGDGTVPYSSATRVTPTDDFNAPGADVRVYRSRTTETNQSVEHTGMAANADVDSALFELLTSPDDLQPSDHDALRVAGPNLAPCLQGVSADAAGPGLAPGVAPGLAAPGTNVPLDHQLRYVSVLGGRDVVVGDDRGASTEPTGPDGKKIDGVTMFPSNVDHAMMATMPVSLDRSFTFDFTATGRSVRLDALQGTQSAPVETARWVDAPLPDGVRARLSLAASGAELLRTDVDGDGTFETTVPPTVRLVGADASDVTAPQVSVSSSVVDGHTRYTVSATDSGSGVDRLAWSTDGAHYQPYTGPVPLDTAVTPTLHSFAQDRAGNRSAAVRTDLATVPVTASTTAVVTPAPGASGWNGGPVRVALAATATSGGPAVTAIDWWLDGATTKAVTRTPGPSVDIDVSAVGATTVHFRSITTSGIPEGERSLLVRIDPGAPTVQLLDPADGLVIDRLDRIAGTAADDASGVAAVEVSLRNAAGRWWDGSGWTTTDRWLVASGSDAWQRTVGLPTGTDLPSGAYRLTVRATDEAGHRTVSPTHAVTVAPTGARVVTALVAPVGETSNSSASAINDRGRAAGAVGGPGDTRAVTWSKGAMASLPSAGLTSSKALAVDDSGAVVGTGSSVAGGTAALWWDATGVQHVLPAYGGAFLSDAAAVIGDGELIVGAAGGLPVRWDRGAASALPLPPGATAGRATDVNRRGTIVGTVDRPEGQAAIRWTVAGPAHLGVLSGGSAASATAVNDAGVTVGSAKDRNGVTRAVVFGPDGPVIIDDGLGAATGRALDINERNEVVGEYTDRLGVEHGFRWTEAGGAADIASYAGDRTGWTFGAARSINEFGQVAGVGTKDGRTVGFVISDLHAPVAGDVATTTAGAPVDIGLDGWDPDPADALTWSIVDGPTHGSASSIVAGTVTYRPAAGFSGVDSFTYRVNDGRFDSVEGVVTVDVRRVEHPNSPPTAVLGGPEQVDEGDPIVMDLSGSSDSDGSIVASQWDLDADGAYDDATGATVTIPTNDDGTVVVGGQVTDDDGATAEVTRTIRVRNVTPIPAPMSSATVLVGQRFAASGTFTDQGADTWTGTVDYGSGTVPLAISGHSFSFDHVFTVPGAVAVTIGVCDDDGGCASRTFDVTVTSPPPTTSTTTTTAPRTTTTARPTTTTSTTTTTTPPLPAGGRGVAVSAGRFVWPGTKDTTSQTLALVVGRLGTVGAVTVDRGGVAPARLGSIVVGGGGVWTVGTDRYARISGTGTAVLRSGSRKVRFEVVVIDGRSADRYWLSVTNLDGTPVPDLSFGGTPATAAVTLTPSATSVAVG